MRVCPAVIWVLVAPLVPGSLRGALPCPASGGNTLGCSQAAALAEDRSGLCKTHACPGEWQGDRAPCAALAPLWSARVSRAPPAELAAAAAAPSPCEGRFLPASGADEEKGKPGERSPPTLPQHIKEPADISTPHVQEFAVLTSGVQGSGQGPSSCSVYGVRKWPLEEQLPHQQCWPQLLSLCSQGPAAVQGCASLLSPNRTRARPRYSTWTILCCIIQLVRVINSSL